MKNKLNQEKYSCFFVSDLFKEQNESPFKKLEDVAKNRVMYLFLSGSPNFLNIFKSSLSCRSCTPIVHESNLLTAQAALPQGFSPIETTSQSSFKIHTRLKSNRDALLVLHMKPRQLERSELLNFENTGQMVILATEKDIEDIYLKTKEIFRSKYFWALKLNDMTKGNKPNDLAKTDAIIGNLSLNSEKFHREIKGTDVTFFCDDNTDFGIILKIAQSAQSARIVMTREFTEIERSALPKNIEVIQFSRDLAAPYTEIDLKAAVNANKVAKSYIETISKDKSLSANNFLNPSILTSLEISLEDKIYSYFRPLYALETIINLAEKNSVIVIATSRLSHVYPIIHLSEHKNLNTYFVSQQFVEPQNWKLKNKFKFLENHPHKTVSFANSFLKRRKPAIAQPLVPRTFKDNCPPVTQNDGLIIAAGDHNYADTVHGLAQSISELRHARVWSIGNCYTRHDETEDYNISVEDVNTNFIARANKSILTDEVSLDFTAKMKWTMKLNKMEEQVILETVSNWFVETLPVLSSWYFGCRDQFKIQRPAYVIASSGRHPVARIAVEAAKSLGIKTLDVQGVLLTDYARLKKPASEFVSVMESMSQALMNKHFSVDSEKIFSGGSVRIKTLLESLPEDFETQKEEEHSAPSVLLMTQPLDTKMSLKAAEDLIDAVAKVGGIKLKIRLHPREGFLSRKNYTDLIEHKKASDFCIVTKQETLLESLQDASLVITFFSNAALEAALLGKNVVSLALNGKFPLDMRESGLAIAADTPEQIQEIIHKYFKEPTFRQKVTNDRERFLDQNKQLFSKDPSSNIIKKIEKESAQL